MKKITRTEYLAALGLFILAGRRIDETESAVGECAKILGTDSDRISDALWGDGSRTEEGFDRVLELEGIQPTPTKDGEGL